MKTENLVAGIVTTVCTIAVLAVGVAAVVYVYGNVEARPEKVGRFVPPANAIVFADNNGTFTDVNEVSVSIEYEGDTTKPEKLYLLTAQDDTEDTVFSIEYEGDTTFYTANGEEMLRIAPNGYIYVRGERVTRDMTVYKGFKNWLMKLGLIPEPKEE